MSPWYVGWIHVCPESKEKEADVSPTPRLKVPSGNEHAPAVVDATRVKTLSETVQLASLCGLGQAAPLAVLSGLAEFPEQFGIMKRA